MKAALHDRHPPYSIPILDSEVSSWAHCGKGAQAISLSVPSIPFDPSVQVDSRIRSPMDVDIFLSSHVGRSENQPRRKKLRKEIWEIWDSGKRPFARRCGVSVCAVSQKARAEI
ncbi:hypothetical protein AB1N83_000219 [Pleurotus pulmonarius]